MSSAEVGRRSRRAARCWRRRSKSCASCSAAENGAIAARTSPLRTRGLWGQLAQEIRRPADFEAAAGPITMEKSTKDAPVGPDPEPYVKAIQKCIDAGFDHVGLHQVGPDQEGFLKFWEKELRPVLEHQKTAVQT